MENLPALPQGALDKLPAAPKPTTSSSFLPRLAPAHSSSDIVTKGDAKFGEFLISGDNVVLGHEVPIVVFHCHNRAQLWEQGEIIAESFDETSETYKRIVGTKKNAETNTDPQHGLEFLVWILSEGRFATIFLAKSAARKSATFLKYSPQGPAAKPHAVMLRAERVEWKQFKWHVPAISCELNPKEIDSSWHQPTAEEITAAYELFTKHDEKPFPRAAPTARPR